jgi:predicted kinase
MSWFNKKLESENKNTIIAQMNKELIIMRGISGSGKSFLAKQLAGENGQIFSADDFFMDEQGNYNWKGSQIGQAHEWNHNRLKKAIEEGISPVVMDNTNITMWDMGQAKPMVEYAIEKGYDIKIEEANSPWAFNAEELANRNSHGLDKNRIQKQINKWTPDITVEDILNYEEK